MAGHLSEAFRAIFPCCRNFHALCRPPDAKKTACRTFHTAAASFFIFMYIFTLPRASDSFSQEKLRTAHSRRHIQYSEKRLRVDDHTVIKYIYIKIAAACDADKLLRLVCGHKFYFFLFHHDSLTPFLLNPLMSNPLYSYDSTFIPHSNSSVNRQLSPYDKFCHLLQKSSQICLMSPSTPDVFTQKSGNLPDNSYSLWNTIKKAGCTAAVISDITILCIRQSLAFTYLH